VQKKTVTVTFAICAHAPPGISYSSQLTKIDVTGAKEKGKRNVIIGR
jgi:hypothetical protein